MGGLKIQGLKSLSELSQDDQVIVVTSEGLRTLSAEVLGVTFSNTSLFDSYSLIEASSVNVQNLSTHNQLRKYLQSDTSDELYLQYSEGQIQFIKASVIKDLNTGKPIVIQATDITGKELYWNLDIKNAIYYNGMPWKTSDEKKIKIVHDITSFPVMVYQYTTSNVKTCEIIMDSLGETTLLDTYYSSGGSSKGVIKKYGKNFIFQMEESGNRICGIQISVNNDNTISGKLIGEWQGITDLDLDSVLRKAQFKDWYYTNYDYNLYGTVLSVSTADKVGWYLNQDTSNHIYTEVKDDYVKIFLAQNRTNSTGSLLVEQAKNIVGQLLYWKQDMTYQSGVNSNHVPIHSGVATFMTAEITNFPVYIFMYNTTELFSLKIDTMSDNSRGARLLFSGLDNRVAEISKSSTEFCMKLTDKETGGVYSSICLGIDKSELKGNWVGINDEIPDYNFEDEEVRVLTSKGGTLSWVLASEINGGSNPDPDPPVEP